MPTNKEYEQLLADSNNALIAKIKSEVLNLQGDKLSLTRIVNSLLDDKMDLRNDKMDLLMQLREKNRIIKHYEHLERNRMQLEDFTDSDDHESEPEYVEEPGSVDDILRELEDEEETK